MLLPLLLAVAPQTFFDLHQAVGHLEGAATRPACVGHRVAAQAHLAQVPAVLPREWARVRDALVAALDAPATSAAELERLRVVLHTLGEAAKLPHHVDWRGAFATCPE